MPHITDHELDTMVLDADPVDVSTVRDLGRGADAAALRDAITAGPPTVSRLRRRRRLGVLAVAAVLAAAVPVTVTLVAPSPPDAAYAAQAVQFARQSPRLLLAAPRWGVTDLNQTDVDAGSMTFTRGGRTLDMDWNTPAKSLIGGQVSSGTPATIAGERALVGPVGGAGPRFFAAVWSIGDVGVLLRGQFPDEHAFLAVARTLHRVSVPSFLAALPASVVTVQGRKAAVDRMLADIPQPPAFDSSALTRSTLLLDRYQLGAHVTGAISCAWVGRYLDGSARERRAASRAMATSRHWAILREMAPEGGWSQAMWELADNLNGTPVAGLVPGETTAEILRNHAC